MRTSGCLAAFLVAGCSAPNPFFELTPGDGSGVAATTEAATTQGPTTDPVGSISASMSDASITASDPSGVTSGGLEPGTSSGVGPGTSTGGEPGTSTGPASSTGAESSTGETQCTLQTDPDFDERLWVNGKLAAQCFGAPIYFHGKLLAGQQELRFNTSGTGCAFEENVGIISLGKGYILPVPVEGPCAKLYVYPDGPGPLCDIGRFYVLQAENQTALVTGSFSSPDMPPPGKVVVTPTLSLLDACCPIESEQCCDDQFGDLALTVGRVVVGPGDAADFPVDGNSVRLANIQSWQTGECLLKVMITRRDWAAIRL